MAIQDSFSTASTPAGEADTGIFRAISRSVSEGFSAGKAGVVKDEIRQIKKFYQNTLDLQKDLMDATGNELPMQIQNMMRSAIKGFDDILDQKVEVNADQAQATLSLVDKIADQKMGSEIVPVMNDLKKISDRQNLQTIANQNAQERMEITSRALGQSMSSFLGSNIDSISNTDLGRELGESLPVALSGPFAPLVSAVSDLVDFRAVGSKLKQGSADAFNKMFKRSVADSEAETNNLIDRINAGNDETVGKLRDLESTEMQSKQTLDDMKGIIEDYTSDQFFAQNDFADSQRNFQEMMLEKLVEYEDLMEKQNELIEEAGEDGGGLFDMKAISGPFGAFVKHLGTFAKFAGKLLVIGALVHTFKSIYDTYQELKNLDLDGFEYLSEFITTAMDKITFGLTSELSDMVSNFITNNPFAEKVTDALFGEIDSIIEDFQEGGPLQAIGGYFERMFERIGGLFESAYDKFIEPPILEAFKGIQDLGERLGILDSQEEKNFDKLVESGVVSDNSGLFDLDKSSIDFGKLSKSGASTDDLKYLRDEIGSDLSNSQLSQLSALIKKSTERSTQSETVAKMPRVKEDMVAKTMETGLARIAEATKKGGKGTTVAVASSSRDDMRLHNDNATMDMVNVSTP